MPQGITLPKSDGGMLDCDRSDRDSVVKGTADIKMSGFQSTVGPLC